MNEIDTARLVNLIIGTWPTGPRGAVWRDVVKPLDAGLVDTVWRELRDVNERITVAEFVGAYKRHEQRGDELTVPPPKFTGDEISLDDYMQRLKRRAATGDVTAQRELKSWKRHPANPTPGSA